MAEIYMAQNKLLKAEVLYTQALEIRESTFSFLQPKKVNHDNYNSSKVFNMENHLSNIPNLTVLYNSMRDMTGSSSHIKKNGEFKPHNNNDDADADAHTKNNTNVNKNNKHTNHSNATSLDSKHKNQIISTNHQQHSTINDIRKVSNVSYITTATSVSKIKEMEHHEKNSHQSDQKLMNISHRSRHPLVADVLHKFGLLRFSQGKYCDVTEQCNEYCSTYRCYSIADSFHYPL